MVNVSNVSTVTTGVALLTPTCTDKQASCLVTWNSRPGRGVQIENFPTVSVPQTPSHDTPLPGAVHKVCHAFMKVEGM